jgi:hypothetical protein
VKVGRWSRADREKAVSRIRQLIPDESVASALLCCPNAPLANNVASNYVISAAFDTGMCFKAGKEVPVPEKAVNRDQHLIDALEAIA